MGFRGLGTDGADSTDSTDSTDRDAVEVSRAPSALDRAGMGTEDRGAVAGTVAGLIESLLDIGIDGQGPFASACAVADVKRAEKPDAEEAVNAVVSSHLRLAAAGGFVTGVGGFIILPLALPVNVLEFYLVATRMVAAVASLRGYDTSRPEIRSAVLLTLVGADADDLLRKAGVIKTGRLADLAAQRLPGPALMVVNKAVGFRLLATVGKKGLTRFGKAVPLIGGVLGASLDGLLLKKIADHARNEFPPRPTGH